MRKPAVVLLRCLILAGLLLPWGPPAATAAPAATYTVVSTVDNPDVLPGNNLCADGLGLCTLRAAVMEANAHAGPDTILLPADTFQLTRAGSNEDAADLGDLDLTGVVTLRGVGPGTSVVDATGLNDRVFEVLTGTQASLTNLTISGGTLAVGTRGGGLENRGSLTLTRSVVTHNNLVGALGGKAGGGIGNELLGRLVLSSSQVISNAASSGGGILNLGLLTFESSQLVANLASDGGAVWNAGLMVITGSQVLSNTALTTGVIRNLNPLFLIRSLVSGNQAADGGGVANDHAGLTIIDSTLSANQASANGGALHLKGGAVTVTHSSLLQNSAGADGGAIYMNDGTLRMGNVTVVSNTAADNGGGAALDGGALTGYNLTVTDNRANIDNSAANGLGGGIYRAAGTGDLFNSVLAFNIHIKLSLSIADDCRGDFGTFHYSLVRAPTVCIFANDNTLTAQDPLLRPLAANGGPTLTRALQPGSPALDAADPAGCQSPYGGLLLTDQRGQGRHNDGDLDGSARCDMGAYELQRLLFLPLLSR